MITIAAMQEEKNVSDVGDATGAEKVRRYLLTCGAGHIIPKICVFSTSSATVELAAEQLSCIPAMIAKSLSLTLSKKESGNYQPILIVASGDAKINASKYRNKFARRPEMIKREDVETVVGFPIGGVCPFGVNDGVRVYLDVSLRRFQTVYPAAGTANTALPISIDELEQFSRFIEWVDVCDGWVKK